MPKIKENQCKEIKIHKLKLLLAKPKELVKVGLQKITGQFLILLSWK